MLVVCSLVVLASFALPQGVLERAGTHRLSAPLSGGLVSDVTGAEVSADGAWIVYLDDLELDGVFELFAVPSDLSQPAHKLNPSLTAGSVTSFALTPDSGRAVYLAHASPTANLEIFSVPLDGSLPAVRLNGVLPPTGHVVDFQISPDSARVVFFGGVDAVNEIASAPIDGSSPAVTVNGPLASGEDVVQYAISPDSASVVWLVSDGNEGALYSAPLDGSQAPVLLGVSLPLPYFASRVFRIAPAGDRVVFNSSAGTEHWTLRSIPIGGGAPVQISTFGSGIEIAFEISPDGAKVAYLRHVLDASDNLYTRAIDASTPQVLLRYQAELDDFLITPDSSRVVYSEHTTDLTGASLSSVLIGGGGAVSLDHLAPGRLSQPLYTSADGQRVVYVRNVGELCAVPTAGGAIQVLATVGSIDPFIGNVFLAPLASGRVVFSTTASLPDPQLFSVPIDGSQAPAALSGSMASNPSGHGSVAAIRARDDFTLYRADQDDVGVMELYRVPTDGSAAPAKVSAPPLLGRSSGDVAEFRVAPAGDRLVYRADQEHDQVFEVYSVPSSDGPAVKLNSALVPGESVSSMAIVPAGDRVAFASNRGLRCTAVDGSLVPILLSSAFVDPFSALEVDAGGTRVAFVACTGPFGNTLRLYSAPLDGSQPAVELNGPLAPSGGSVQRFPSFQLSPDGRRVAYAADQNVFGTIELFGAPLDGSQPAVRLSGPLVAGGNVKWFGISPDSSRVVYVADQLVDEVYELFSVPLDGSAAPIRLNSALPPFGGLLLFAARISPDGLSVAFVADALTNDQFELFVVPILGGQAPLRLNAPLPAAGDVGSYQFSPDGGRVLYLADQSSDQVFELYSVPSDGSALPVRLNGNLVAGGDVLRFEVAAGVSRVVYTADQNQNDRIELFSVPITGGTPIQLNGALVTSGDVVAPPNSSPGDFVLGPGNLGVLYRADQRINDTFELFQVPVDGSRPAQAMTSPFPGTADVEGDFAFDPAGGRVFFRADRLEDDTIELFAHDLGPRATPAPGHP